MRGSGIKIQGCRVSGVECVGYYYNRVERSILITFDVSSPLLGRLRSSVPVFTALLQAVTQHDPDSILRCRINSVSWYDVDGRVGCNVGGRVYGLRGEVSCAVPILKGTRRRQLCSLSEC